MQSDVSLLEHSLQNGQICIMQNGKSLCPLRFNYVSIRTRWEKAIFYFSLVMLIQIHFSFKITFKQEFYEMLDVINKA